MAYRILAVIVVLIVVGVALADIPIPNGQRRVRHHFIRVPPGDAVPVTITAAETGSLSFPNGILLRVGGPARLTPTPQKTTALPATLIRIEGVQVNRIDAGNRVGIVLPMESVRKMAK